MEERAYIYGYPAKALVKDNAVLVYLDVDWRSVDGNVAMDIVWLIFLGRIRPELIDNKELYLIVIPDKIPEREDEWERDDTDLDGYRKVVSQAKGGTP